MYNFNNFNMNIFLKRSRFQTLDVPPVGEALSVPFRYAPPLVIIPTGLFHAFKATGPLSYNDVN